MVAINKLFKANILCGADNKTLRRKVDCIIAGEYGIYLSRLFQYYEWLSATNKTFTKLPETSLKSAADFPLDYLRYYIIVLGFNEYLNKKGGKEWWLDSLPELQQVKALTHNEEENYAIVENWLLTVPFQTMSSSRNGRILMDIFGQKLFDYLKS